MSREVHSMLEPRTTCVHDHEINTPNIQDFSPLNNDICIKDVAGNPLKYIHEWKLSLIDPNHTYMPKRSCEKYG